MPHKIMRMQRAGPGRGMSRRPSMLAIAGDSAAGKTTLTRGLIAALGAGRSTSICVDDYHRYDRAERAGQLTRPELVEPREFVIVEGLLPLHTKLARACFDVSVYLNPAEHLRRAWKVARDTRERGYTTEQVLAELGRREPDSEAFIRPQRASADIVVRFAPIPGRADPPGTPFSAELLLRHTISHPDLSGVLAEGDQPLAITQLLLLSHLLEAAA